MPEGDTVHLTASRLHAALAGQTLLATDFRVPRLATTDLAGARVTEVAARGKHLLLRTDTGHTLHTHLQLQGAWYLFRPGARWRGPAHEIRVALHTAPWVAVGYRIPVCELLPTSQEERVTGHLGPDPLEPDWDPEEATRRLAGAASAAPDVEIGVALLDQRLIAGLGNVYKNEICFLRGINPFTPVEHVSDLPGLVDLAARLLHANRSTGAQVTTGDPRPGRSRWVHDRANQPCRRCATPIRRQSQQTGHGPRITFWCPNCQPPEPQTRS